MITLCDTCVLSNNFCINETKVGVVRNCKEDGGDVEENGRFAGGIGGQNHRSHGTRQ